MRKESFVITLAIFIIISLSVIQVVISNRLSTAGVSLAKIEEEIQFYKAQNSMMLEELLTASSLSTIASRAALLGFIEDKSQFVLKTSMPLAARRP